MNKKTFALMVLLLVLGSIELYGAVYYDDIIISPPREDMGESEHGYLEYVFDITNTSENNHKVKLDFSSDNFNSGDFIYSISREVIIGPKATVKIRMYQPPLYMQTNAVNVHIDNKKQKEKLHVNRSEHARSWWGGHNSQNTVLISRSINYDDFKNSHDEAKSIPPSKKGRRRSGLSGDEINLIKSEIPSKMWSDNWLAYTRYDGVVLSVEDLTSAGEGVKSALMQYVQCGGTLLIIGDHQQPGIEMYKNNMLQHANIGFGVFLVSEFEDFKNWDGNTWHFLSDEAWGITRRPFADRWEMEDANKRFPIVANLGIPVKGLFAMVLVFTIIIGPVNIIILARKKRRIWFLWTVPAVSLITCCFVFLYALFAEGIKGYIRTESITVLDQSNQQAATLGISACYSPLTPGKGLTFDRESEVTPLATGDNYGDGGRPRTVDWTEYQNFASGWAIARVPSYFRIRKNEMRKERIKFRKTEDNKVLALNGLGGDIVNLWYEDDQGNIYHGENIIAGKENALNFIKMGVQGDSINHEHILRNVYAKNWTSLCNNLTNKAEKKLRPGCYIAEMNNSVFMETYIDNLKSEQYRSVIYGITKESI